MTEPDSTRSDRWDRIKTIVGRALERGPDERTAFVAAACGDDVELNREVESLLEAHSASISFFQTPPADPSSPKASQELAEGQTLGCYRVLRALGRGGMATVYLAHDLRHRRSVALKVLHPHLALALGPGRFQREIELAANLSHPHILPLHDSGEEAGLLYYVMPYVEGETLRDRLRRETRLAVPDAVQITLEVADALAHAHAHGVIHRDIKPANILLNGGHAVVADFGIARLVEPGGAERVTETGMIVGTVGYMSPEQASGDRQLDGRSDVYSLGCVLFEILAGEPPFDGPTVRSILIRQLRDPPPRVRGLRPELPDHLDEVLARALAPAPDDRFGTAAEFTQALRQSGVAGTSLWRRAVSRARRSRGMAATAIVAAGVALVVAGAWVTVSRRERSLPERPAGRILAVLPFENLGDSADAYFAAGVSDEIRSRLSSIPGIQVIGRGSSNEYRHSDKTAQQIARELGVNYLVTATVRPADSGASRTVHLNPELLEVAGSGGPRAIWQGPFAEPVTNVFRAYDSIVMGVAKAMDLPVSDSTRTGLARRPTRNSEAYEAYLQGEADGLGRGDPGTLRDALPHYARAVGLDSTFAEAWARLSTVYSQLYFNGSPSPEYARLAGLGAERAVAIAPDESASHLAMGYYRQFVTRDVAGAAAEYSAALRSSPDNPEPLAAIAQIEQIAGLWDQAIAHFQRAQQVEPRAAGVALNVAMSMLWTRRYPEAERAIQRTLALDPHHIPAIEMAAMIDAARGDLAAARARIAGAPPSVARDALAAEFAMVWDLVWMLDESQQQAILRTTPKAFFDDRGIWGVVLAQTLWLHGQRALAASYADSARVTLSDRVRENPKDDQQHLLLGLSLAYLGRKDEAIREGLRGLALGPMSSDALYGPYNQHLLIRIYLLTGERDKAIEGLERLLKVPYFLSPGWLRIDPTFQPLRGHPRFERLLSGAQ